MARGTISVQQCVELSKATVKALDLDAITPQVPFQFTRSIEPIVNQTGLTGLKKRSCTSVCYG
jgi:hypothetical protein